MRLEKDSVVDGRYRILRRLGSGGMADVWCAEDAQLGRKVALKVLHDRFAQDREFVERFRREASSAAGLQHPNVVGIYDRGEVDGTYYIAMQYVEGASLKQLIEGGLGVQQGLMVIRQVLEAARFAHEHGIVHRDLKPHNVLVDADGRATVTDFGIARAGHSEITQTGSVMGTAQYLSPEQAQGLETTPASDLYSIGVMLYEVLTGRVPFEADSAVAVALKQVSERPRAPSELNPQVPPALDSVVLKALAKDPANRYSSATEMLHALDEAEQRPFEALGQTAAFEPAAPLPPAEKRPRSPRRRQIALGIAGALLIALAIWALTRPGQVTVPDVVRPGTDVEEATATLEAAELEVEQQGEPSAAAEGQVLETSPSGGSVVDEGSTVVVIYSEGLGSAEVPDVSGLLQLAAKRELEASGFAVKAREEFSAEVAAGLVIRTEPAAGTRADRAEPVTIYVSKGPDVVSVPDVLGQTENSAEAELERAEFVVNVDTAPSDAEEGTVFEQDPGAGEAAPRGSEVTIVVSEGPGTVSVPDVEGRHLESAIASLESLGLEANVEKVDTEDPREDDIVLDQFPSAGTEARPGSIVTIRVGVLAGGAEPIPPTIETPPEVEVP